MKTLNWIMGWTVVFVGVAVLGCAWVYFDPTVMSGFWNVNEQPGVFGAIQYLQTTAEIKRTASFYASMLTIFDGTLIFAWIFMNMGSKLGRRGA